MIPQFYVYTNCNGDTEITDTEFPEQIITIPYEQLGILIAQLQKEYVNGLVQAD